MSQKGHVHDLNIFGVHYLDNGWTYRICYNGAPIGYDYLGSNGQMADDVT